MESTDRKQSLDRQRDIITAVIEIIGRRGATGLTAATIAKEVGVTSGALFRHFRTLEDIYRAVLIHAEETIQTTFPEETLAPIDRILALARNRVIMLGGSPGLAWLMRSDQIDGLFPRDGVDQLRKVNQRSKAFLLAALNDGIQAGTVRDDIDSDVLLLIIMGTIHSLIGKQEFQPANELSSSALSIRTLLGLQTLLSVDRQHYLTFLN